MPRYFFHIRNGHSFEDEDGIELPDLATAKAEAVRVAGQLLFDEPDKLLASPVWCVEVCDRTGPVFTLRIVAE